MVADKEFSEQENRFLSQFKAPTLETLKSGEFMEDFEDYVIDQFPLRDQWIQLKAWCEKTMGKQENNNVYFGDKDTLITRFDEPDSTKVANNLSYVNKFVENVDIPVYFSLIPTQACIWADRLPEGAPNADQIALLDQAMDSTSAQWADVYGALAAHSEEDIFYRTDHHWTSLGAYYAYTALCEAMGITPVPLEQYTKTTVSEDFYGTVFSSSGVRWVAPDVMDTYVPEEGITVTSLTYDSLGNPVEEPRQLYDESYLSVKDKYSMFLGGNQPLCVVTTQNTAAPKLLIIRDSFTDSLVPFLTAHFSEIHLIDLRYYKLSVPEYIGQNGIDTALVLYGMSNFTSDSNLIWLGR